MIRRDQRAVLHNTFKVFMFFSNLVSSFPRMRNQHASGDRNRGFVLSPRQSPLLTRRELQAAVMQMVD